MDTNLTEDKKVQLDRIVQDMIKNKESDSNIRFVVNDFKQKYNSQTTEVTPPKKSIGQKILDVGTKVANFVGAKGITEQFGADIARARAPQDQKNLVEYPKMKEVVGSAIQTGANFIPGVGRGASLGVKALAGAGTGYAFDVGSKLQDKEKTVGQSLVPGMGTAVGVALPLAGALFGKLTEKGSKQLAQNLEKSNLRLTPKDKSFIEKDKPDFINWLTEKKITGNPEQRYAKIDKVYNDLETQVQQAVKKTGETIKKVDFIKAVEQIPEQFIDDPQLYDASQSAVEKLIKTAQEKYADEIPLDFVNAVKRNYGKRAFDKAAQQVVNESSYQISQNLYDLIKEKVPTLEGLNSEYSKVILAKKLMYKALGRSQIGIVGKIAASAVGGTVGSAIGGPVGAGVGIVAGEKIASNLLGTKTRSLTGATLQKLYEKVSKAPKGKTNFQISKKLLMNLIESSNR